MQRDGASATITGIRGGGYNGFDDKRRVARIEGQIGNVFLAEVHFHQRIQTRHVVGVLYPTRAVGVELEQGGMEASVVDLTGVKVSATALPTSSAAWTPSSSTAD